MVTHDIKNHKFKIESLKGLSCLEYDLTGHVFTVLHTIVPAALSGKGLAAQLAEAAYNWAVKNRYTVRSDCTYKINSFRFKPEKHLRLSFLFL